jgi:hypothetical protein
VSERYAWEPDQEAAQRNRRSVYILAKRNMRFPLFEAFDQPDLHQSCARRAVTVSAPQSLALLNSELTLELARCWAERLAHDYGSQTREMVQAAYRAAYSRAATDEEIRLAEVFLDVQPALKQVRDADVPSSTLGVEAVAEFCHALFNSNEFIMVD